MGPGRPSSVPETCSWGGGGIGEKPAFEFVPGGRGARNVAASGLGPRGSEFGLAPRLGGRPSLGLHLRARRYLLRSSWAGSGPGPVQGAGTLLTGCGAPTPSQHPGQRQRQLQGRQLRGPLPRSSARSRGRYEGCCGWPRPPPLSPYRTRGPEQCLALHPGEYGPAVPGGAEAGKSVPHPIGEGREEVRGPAAAAQRREGAGSRPGRAPAAPLAP